MFSVTQNSLIYKYLLLNNRQVNINLSGDYMLNYIWAGMMLVSIIFSFANGTAPKVCSALTEGAGEGVELVLGMAGIMAFWTGIMKIAERSQLTDFIAKLFSPVINFIYPETKKDTEAGAAIAMNMTANFFGMGNAATPLGLSAMKKLSKYSKNGSATASMCNLAVANCASIQLIPSTLIAIRSAAGSANPSEIIAPIWIVSVITFVFAITLSKALGRRI